MTDIDRDRLRKLQDRWLERFDRRVPDCPQDEPVVPGGPTVGEIRRCVLPEWERWFRDELADDD